MQPPRVGLTEALSDTVTFDASTLDLSDKCQQIEQMTDPDKRKSLPLYRRIADEIVAGIARGTYPVGSLLPTEEVFCHRYAVSRHTVREALRAIETMGLVSRRQGQGTRVLASPQDRRLRVSFSTLRELEQHTHDIRLNGITASLIEADEGLALELKCAPGDRFLRIRCTQDPVDPFLIRSRAVHETIVIEAYAELLARLPKNTRPVFHLLEDMFNERIHTIEQEVAAVVLTPRQAGLLEVPKGSAGLRIKRTYHGHPPNPVMLTYNTYAGDHFTLTLDLRAD